MTAKAYCFATLHHLIQVIDCTKIYCLEKKPSTMQKRVQHMLDQLAFQTRKDKFHVCFLSALNVTLLSKTSPNDTFHEILIFTHL